MSDIFLSLGELVDLYTVYKRRSINMTDAEEVLLIEELLSSPPGGRCGMGAHLSSDVREAFPN